MLEAPKYELSSAAPLAWLGDPVSIKAPTSIPSAARAARMC